MCAHDQRKSGADVEIAVRGLRVGRFGNKKIFMLNVVWARQRASKGIVVANHAYRFATTRGPIDREMR